jgi:hypothetical protein
MAHHSALPGGTSLAAGEDAGTAAATAYTTWQTYKALPLPDRPYVERDVEASLVSPLPLTIAIPLIPSHLSSPPLL